ncbi:MAG TPA: ABC transporter substrate-binding protein [Stellaceae bacterium]|jgi:ABC-type nitrate/sulfonate/bicarbonate transport system substrate-binding protein|nr:ABC transporter substrate-binding protein [Stellaceae bacterium]
MSRTRGSLALIAVSIVALSCIGPHASAAETVRVGTSAIGSYFFELLDVGTGAGIFAKHDIKLERIDFPGGSQLAQGISAGSVDIALSGSTDLVFIAKGMPAKAVTMVSAAPVDFAIMVRDDGVIVKPEQLKGKRIGVTSPTSLTAWLALDFAKRQGWQPGDITLASIGSTPSEIAALQVKNIDAFVGNAQAGYLLEAKKQGFAVVTFDYLTTYITHILYASDAFIKDHPKTVRDFIAAWFDLVKFARTHKDETIGLSMPGTKLPLDVAAKTYDVQTPALSLTGRFEPQALEALGQSFIDLHLLDQLPTLSDLYTEKFLPPQSN